MMNLNKKAKQLQSTPHKGLEKTLSILSIVLGVAAFGVLLRTSTASYHVGAQNVLGPLLLVGWGCASLALKWLQKYHYADTLHKRHPLDERQMQLRLRIFYRSFFIVSVLFSFFVMVLVTNLFGVTNNISTQGSAITALAVAWLCFTTPSIVAAWTKDA